MSSRSPGPVRGAWSAWRRPAAAAGVFVLFAGMLFWTKLRMVSEIPRQAYAVPEEATPDRPVEPAATEPDDRAGETVDGADDGNVPDPTED